MVHSRRIRLTRHVVGLLMEKMKCTQGLTQKTWEENNKFPLEK
jgi:hypothetical protein